MIGRKFIPILSFLLLISPPMVRGSKAPERLTLQSPLLTVIYEPPYQFAAEHLFSVYSTLMEEIDNMLTWRLRTRPTVILVSDRNTFEKMSGSPYISAFALPGRDIVVIHLDVAGFEPYAVNEVFKHELCHLVLNHHIDASFLPKWLDEGLCQWVSGSLGDFLGNRSHFSSAGVDMSIRYIPLSRLTRDFPRDRELLLLAYQESRAFVEFLTSQYGNRALLDLLGELSRNIPFETAFRRVYDQDLDAVEARWGETRRGVGIWLVWLSQYMTEVLFFLGALLTIVAFVRIMIRKRRARIDEEEEELEDAD